MSTLSAEFAAKKEKKRRAALKERHFTLTELDRVVRTIPLGDSASVQCTALLLQLSYLTGSKVIEEDIQESVSAFLGSMTELTRYLSERPLKVGFSDYEGLKEEFSDYLQIVKYLEPLVEKAGYLWLNANLRFHKAGNFNTVIMEEEEEKGISSAILKFCEILPFIDKGLWECVQERAAERWRLVSTGVVDENFNFIN